MWEFVFDTWKEFGAQGLVIALLGVGIWRLWKDIQNILAEHRKDREQWSEISREDQKETRGVVKHNTEVMAKLHTMIDERVPKR